MKRIWQVTWNPQPATCEAENKTSITVFGPIGTSREFRATRSKSASSFSPSEVRGLDFICNSLALAIVRLYLAGNALPRVTKLAFFGLHRVHSHVCLP